MRRSWRHTRAMEEARAMEEVCKALGPVAGVCVAGTLVLPRGGAAPADQLAAGCAPGASSTAGSPAASAGSCAVVTGSSFEPETVTLRAGGE